MELTILLPIFFSFYSYNYYGLHWRKIRSDGIFDNLAEIPVYLVMVSITISSFSPLTLKHLSILSLAYLSFSTLSTSYIPHSLSDILHYCGT